MGIINVTPDSFSDGGRYLDPQQAVAHARQLLAAGADLLDLGGESTRPYSTPVPAAEELRRVIPVLQALAPQCHVPISIDTSKAVVARAAIAQGAEIINDVTALTGDPDMIAVALETGAAVCAMHMQGTPQTMQDNPSYQDVVSDVLDHLRQRRDELAAAGIPREKIALDPGIGFGKTHDHNLALLRGCRRFRQLGCPLLWGPSRKGFIGHVLGDKELPRDYATIGVALALAAGGVQVLRVHNVAAVKQALLLFEAAGGLEPEV
jgi:dihydropteroate synthase